ncbi:LPS export ABC transporter periplasmic protein LptC [Thalassospira lucentensis]|uniref:LPS export ABC transporter periplasmic protein LptC n=1 Tax=Thalassospira lucentensis TaxID=168935 RepID=UPI00142D4466|nr:LPS export ABC transporter periplasmic protein LptC [Thalassospira lucentensis]NIZ00694.1 LPS export ABC transporter periplasmic protein LptC [Thalassospira lucentensis]
MTEDQAKLDEKAARDARSRDRMPSGRRNVSISPFRRIIVRSLKFVLPLIAMTLMALVVLWPQIEEVQESGFRVGFSTSPEDLMENVAMSNPRFFGVDGNRQPFTVTAQEAVESKAEDGHDDHVYLDAPQADMTLKDGSWIALTANEGFYTETDGLLDLVGAVNMYHDNGFELHTQKAEVEMNEGNARGSVPVDGQGPFGTINSDSGFELENKGKVIRFLGNAKMVIFDSALKGKS